MSSISLRAVRRLMVVAGAERISDDAVKRLRDFAEKFIIEVTRRALIFMEHANRRTLREEDIVNAIRIMFSGLAPAGLLV